MEKSEIMRLDETKEQIVDLKLKWKDKERELLIACLDGDEDYILKCAKRMRDAWDAYNDLNQEFYWETGIAV